MSELTLIRKGEYKSSEKTIKGSREEILQHLRDLAYKMRKESREAHKLPKGVHSLPYHAHQSNLVTMATFEIGKLNMDRLLALINAHGVMKYEVVII